MIPSGTTVVMASVVAANLWDEVGTGESLKFGVVIVTSCGVERWVPIAAVVVSTESSGVVLAGEPSPEEGVCCCSLSVFPVFETEASFGVVVLRRSVGTAAVVAFFDVSTVIAALSAAGDLSPLIDATSLEPIFVTPSSLFVTADGLSSMLKSTSSTAPIEEAVLSATVCCLGAPLEVLNVVEVMVVSSSVVTSSVLVSKADESKTPSDGIGKAEFEGWESEGDEAVEEPTDFSSETCFPVSVVVTTGADAVVTSDVATSSASTALVDASLVAARDVAPSALPVGESVVKAAVFRSSFSTLKDSNFFFSLITSPFHRSGRSLRDCMNWTFSIKSCEIVVFASGASSCRVATVKADSSSLLETSPNAADVVGTVVVLSVIVEASSRIVVREGTVVAERVSVASVAADASVDSFDVMSVCNISSSSSFEAACAFESLEESVVLSSEDSVGNTVVVAVSDEEVTGRTVSVNSVGVVLMDVLVASEAVGTSATVVVVNGVVVAATVVVPGVEVVAVVVVVEGVVEVDGGAVVVEGVVVGVVTSGAGVVVVGGGVVVVVSSGVVEEEVVVVVDVVVVEGTGSVVVSVGDITVIVVVGGVVVVGVDGGVDVVVVEGVVVSEVGDVVDGDVDGLLVLDDAVVVVVVVVSCVVALFSELVLTAGETGSAEAGASLISGEAVSSSIVVVASSLPTGVACTFNSVVPSTPAMVASAGDSVVCSRRVVSIAFMLSVIIASVVVSVSSWIGVVSTSTFVEGVGETAVVVVVEEDSSLVILGTASIESNTSGGGEDCEDTVGRGIVISGSSGARVDCSVVKREPEAAAVVTCGSDVVEVVESSTVSVASSSFSGISVATVDVNIVSEVVSGSLFVTGAFEGNGTSAGFSVSSVVTAADVGSGDSVVF